MASALLAQRPEVAPTRLEEGEEITIDGEFAEEVWGRAVMLGDLTQVQPVEGAEPTHPTTVWLAYDKDYLFVGIRCADVPGEINARLMQRDANLDPDDRVELWVDTFGTRRFGYWFQIGAGGSRGDALLADGGNRFNKRWDGIWYGVARVTDKGWQAEIALPFKTLGFDRDATAWGFNLRRLRKESNEEMRWAFPLVGNRFFNLAVGGSLVGIEGVEQGVGLDVIPYVRASASRDRAVDRHTSRTGDFGIDLDYNLTPSLNLLLTYNTDFAETEVDDRQINLSRFPLFFPEKRDFFLQDAGQFEFGAPSGGPRRLAFFSRRIGLDANGDPNPVLGGVKVTGRVGDSNVGVLGSLLDETVDDAEKVVGVARFSQNVGEESSVGVIATGGRPIGSGDAATYGADFRLSNSQFLGPGRSASLWGYWMASDNAGSMGDGAAYGTLLQLRTGNWEQDLSFDAIDRGFSPELGFVSRTGIRRYAGETEYTWRGEGDWIQTLEFALRPSFLTRTGNRVDSWDVPLRYFDLELPGGDQFQLSVERSFERVPTFNVGRGVMVAAGDYSMTRHFVNILSTDRRALSADFRLETGDFFSGNLTRWSFSPKLIPNRYFQLSGSYEQFRVRLDEGRFNTHVTEGRLDLTFSPDISWRNLVQYDSDSKDLSVQSRFHWILEPGQDLFLLAVYGWNRAMPGEPLVPTNQDVTLKFSYTVRF